LGEKCKSIWSLSLPNLVSNRINKGSRPKRLITTGRADFFQPNLPSQAGREAPAELYGDETPISDVDGLSAQRRRISGSQATIRVRVKTFLRRRRNNEGIDRIPIISEDVAVLCTI